MFVGPNKHFSIVIDEFDGKIVKAWHIENSKGEKSPNLATRAGGKHIDLVVGKACRSTAHFISRFYPAMYDETLNTDRPIRPFGTRIGRPFSRKSAGD